jgi:hypothetical protein
MVTAARRLRVASVQMEHQDGSQEANFAKIEDFVAQAACWQPWITPASSACIQQNGAPVCWKIKMRSRLLTLLLCAPLAAVTCPAGAATEVHERLTALARDIVYTSAVMFPTQATQLGIPGHDGELETPSERNRSAYIDKLHQWQQRLEEIAPAGRADLELVERNDARLLGAQLTGSLNLLLVRGTDRKDYCAGANNIVSTIFYQLQFLPVARREGKAAADVSRAWTDITNRLTKAPQYIGAFQKLVTTPGNLYGVVGREQLDGARASSTAL